MTTPGTDATEAFEVQLIRRLPLARAVMEMFRFAFDARVLAELYERNRGRCYTGELEFPVLVGLVRDALLEHQGSGHRMYSQLERAGKAPVDESSFYRKLGNVPVEVSRALLAGCTRRLSQLVPSPVASPLLPGCVEAFEVVVLDGKKIKGAARRLLPTRGYKGSLLGAKALVAMSLRQDLALAMSDSLDGEANEVPLVGALMPQLYDALPPGRPMLLMADRQFGDYRTPRQLLARPGDHILLRVRSGLAFAPEPELTRAAGVDDQGRAFRDEVGSFGAAKHALRLRRVTLTRKNDDGKNDDVTLITDLLDRAVYPAADLLKLYRRRWGIERMFQEVTETFSLRRLIGCRPRGVLFQTALCLLMYNLVQVVKAYVAADGRVERATVSTSNLFYDVKRELAACSYLAPGALQDAAGHPPAAAEEMCRRLAELLRGSWDPVAYPKAVDKNPRPPRKKRASLHGGHTSVQRILEGKVKVRSSK